MTRLHRDHFGRLYFDTCATDEEHMRAPVAPGDDRRRCRVYLDDLLAEHLGQEVFDIQVVKLLCTERNFLSVEVDSLASKFAPADPDRAAYLAVLRGIGKRRSEP